MKLQTLYRPIGFGEFRLIKDSGFRKFPPRLEWQPIFYPVLNIEYARQIAVEWNTNDDFSSNVGIVTSFDLPKTYLEQYTHENVGGKIHNELWVPAEKLEEFNSQIHGTIRIEEIHYGENFDSKLKVELE